MTDTERHEETGAETHGETTHDVDAGLERPTEAPTLDVDAGLEALKTAELRDQIEQQNQADAAADALEVLDDAAHLASGAATLLEAELAETLGDAVESSEATDEHRAQWTQDVVSAVEASNKFSDEGRFFARIANQLVEIRQATRIAQAINQHYPTFLQDLRAQGDPEVEIEALFGRARAGATAIFSLIDAMIRTLERCDPPGQRARGAGAQATGMSGPIGPASRSGPQPPANLAAPAVQTQPLRGVPRHLRGNPPDTEYPEPPVDPVRAKVVEVQRKLEAERAAKAEQSGRGGIAPAVGRVAPTIKTVKRKTSGPVANREVVVERDAATSLILVSRNLLEDLRRRSRAVSRERIGRYCQSVRRLADGGRVSEKLGRFAAEVEQHQNPKNVAKLASFFLAEIKRGPQAQ